MERERYLSLLEADGQLLRAAATHGLDATVPTCPGWTVRDAVQHVAEVYEHKLACIAGSGTKPDPWPPAWPADRDPLEWYADAHARLLDVLRSTDPAAPSWTWLPDDQTAGFWVRRMAQETAVHRVDVESAFGAITPVDAELAIDGIDEVLNLMLAGDWSDEPQDGSTGSAQVSAGDATWHVAMTPEEVTVDTSRTRADAEITGAPSDVLLWLWGRASDDQVELTGDPQAGRRFRDRLAFATQ